MFGLKLLGIITIAFGILIFLIPTSSVGYYPAYIDSSLAQFLLVIIAFMVIALGIKISTAKR